MMNISEKVIRLVTEGDTRWYSYYSLILSLFDARKSLEAFKSLIQSDPSVMGINKSVQGPNTIGSSTFWMKIGLISELLRPLTIEIIGCGAGFWPTVFSAHSQT